MPLFDWLSSGHADVYEAIFDVDLELEQTGLDLFDSEGEGDRGDRDHEHEHDERLHALLPQLQAHARAQAQRESTDMGRHSLAPTDPSGSRTPTRPSSGTARALSRSRSQASPSPSRSPHLRNRKISAMSAVVSSSSGEVPTIGPRSPLSKLFGVGGSGAAVGRFGSARDVSQGLTQAQAQIMMERTEAGLKKVEVLLEDVRNLPVSRLKEDIKELQVRVPYFDG